MTKLVILKFTLITDDSFPFNKNLKDLKDLIFRLFGNKSDEEGEVYGNKKEDK